MLLKRLGIDLTVCQITDFDLDLFKHPYTFLSHTDDELSLVCPTVLTPEKTIKREDGWVGFKIDGVLDFSLIGILSKIAGILAENQISIFAISTYNTDYILIKKEKEESAIATLKKAGYEVE